MWPHRTAAITARSQGHRRPEGRDLRDVLIPILDRIFKDRADQFIRAGTIVKCADQLGDQGLVDVWMRNVCVREGIAHSRQFSLPRARSHFANCHSGRWAYFTFLRSPSLGLHSSNASFSALVSVLNLSNPPANTRLLPGPASSSPAHAPPQPPPAPGASARRGRRHRRKTRPCRTCRARR